ncbi:hypothetical protein WJX74_004700 [Apatococcus lobatus]|uniref:Uncharacterized protein n=1 Tax=Apatococcus lobatus TaxID=904363 RepID=A0AAW1RB38_9CHLO
MTDRRHFLAQFHAGHFYNRPRCSFGTLPGLWWHGDGHSGWRTLEPECQLEELVGNTTGSFMAPAEETGEVSILFFGDSVARTLVADICTNQVLWDSPSFIYSMGVESFCLCRNSRFTVARQALIGVHPEGPWPQGVEGPPSERIAHGFKRFNEELSRRPDIVVLSSAFWDLARWVEHFPSLVAADSLDQFILAAWAQQLSDVMQMIEEHAPMALWVSYTTAPPEQRKCQDGTGLLKQEVLGKNGHLIELNSAL